LLKHNEFSLTIAHENILRSIYVFYYLTAKQICRLHYSPGSFTRVEKLLKELRDSEYLQWDILPIKRRFGSSPAYYRLARRGVSYLRKLGFDVSILPYPSEKKEMKSLFIPHTLSVNDFLIAATLLSQVAPYIQLIQMKHELLLKRTLKGAVIPDGWLDFRISEKEQVCFWLEMDRDTEDVQIIKQKIYSMVKFVQNTYQEVFQTPSLTIVFATTGGSGRVHNLIKWTEQELTALHETKEADLFRFAAITQGELDPAWLFFKPVWTRPFDTTLFPLFAKE
jgi:hypothetical protein